MAGEPLRAGDSALTLDGGIVVIDKGMQSQLRPIKLDFVVRDGRWNHTVWHTTMFFAPRYATREPYNKSKVGGGWCRSTRQPRAFDYPSRGFPPHLGRRGEVAATFYQASSKRSRFITLFHAATKSRTSFSRPSAAA